MVFRDERVTHDICTEAQLFWPCPDNKSDVTTTDHRRALSFASVHPKWAQAALHARVFISICQCSTEPSHWFSQQTPHLYLFQTARRLRFVASVSAGGDFSEFSKSKIEKRFQSFKLLYNRIFCPRKFLCAPSPTAWSEGCCKRWRAEREELVSQDPCTPNQRRNQQQQKVPLLLLMQASGLRKNTAANTIFNYLLGCRYIIK